jgi:hypothetical protein
MTQRNDVMECLPATPPEIAAITGLSMHTVHAVLHYWRAERMAIKTIYAVANDCPGRGPKYSLIWSRVDPRHHKFTHMGIEDA